VDDLETITVEIQIQPYGTQGVVSWHLREERISILVSEEHGTKTVAIRANQAGLQGLARELLTLAQDGVPVGSNVYLMAAGEAPTLLEPGSASLHISLQ
jgi:hypothetical protein